MSKKAPVHWVSSSKDVQPKVSDMSISGVSAEPVKLAPPFKEMAEYMLKEEGYTFKGSNRVEFAGGVLLAFRGTKKVGSENSARYAVVMIEADGTVAWFETMSRKEKEIHLKFVSNRNRGERRSQLTSKEQLENV